MTPTAPAIKPENKPRLTLRDHLESPAFAEAVSKALPRHLKPDRFVRIAITTMNRIPKLAQCEQGSFLNSLLTLSQLGLEPDGRRAHLIPFENRKRGIVECQLIIDWKGLSELIYRSGIVSTLHADIVRRGDIFKYSMGVLSEHVPYFLRDDAGKPNEAGEIFAAYSTATMKDGSRKTEVLSFDEIESVRRRSRAATSGPWVTDWNEMAKKTAFRRLSKWLPLSPEIRDAVEVDDDAIDIESKPTSPRASSLNEMIAAPVEPVTPEQAAHIFTREDAEREIQDYILDANVSEKALLKEVTDAKLISNDDGFGLFELSTDNLSAVAAYVKAKAASTAKGGE